MSVILLRSKVARVVYALMYPTIPSVQLPKRAARDPTATEDEYRDWSEDESTEPVDDQVVRQSCLFAYYEAMTCT